jgi:hypothetical protein
MNKKLKYRNLILMKYLTILFLSVIFYSCESNTQSFNLPDKVETTDLNKKINIKGTQF